MAETQLNNAGSLDLYCVAEALKFLAGLNERPPIACDLDQHDLTLAIGTRDDTAHLQSMSGKRMV